MKKAISLRINEILNQSFSVNKKILNFNYIYFESFFPDKELANKGFNITNKTGNFNEALNDLSNIGEEKFDLIFLQLPVGIRKPDPLVVLEKLIDKNLVNGGFVLNISTMNSFSVKLENYFPNFTRFRENILGEIYKKETSVNFSMYEYIKGPIGDLWMSGIYSSDFRTLKEEDKNLDNISVVSTSKAYFHSAKMSFAQNNQIDDFKKKNLIPKYLKDVALHIKSVDLLKSNKKRENVLSELKNFTLDNIVFTPMIPSKSSKTEIKVDNLKASRYWLLSFNSEFFINEYVQNFLNSNEGREQLLSLSVGGFIPHLNMQSLGRICIPTKKTSEQITVVKNRKKIAYANEKFNKYIEKLTNTVEDDDFEYRPEKLFEEFPDYTIRNLIKMDESISLERKSTLRWSIKEKKINTSLADTVLKTIVAFLNTEGGTLIVGQDDEKNILGIEMDKFKNQDDCSKFLKDKIKSNIGIKYLETYIKYSFHKIEEKTLLIVNCTKLPIKETAFLNETDFYKRTGPSNEKLSTKETLEYIELKKDIDLNNVK